jgi:MFS transporter, DHA1 family, inner membrane transport protein
MSKFTRLEAKILALLAFVNFSHIMDFMIMMPLEPQFTREFSITPYQFGLLVSSYTFAASIMGFSAAFFLDFWDRKKALTLFYTGFCAGTIFCAFAPNYEVFLAARFATGAFGGVLSSICMSMVADLFPINRRASAMGVLMMGFSIASVIGVPVGLKLAQLYGWHAPFLALGGISSTLIIVIITLVPSMRGHIAAKQKHSPLATIGHVIKDGNQMLALFFMSALIMGQFTVISFLSPAMVANMGVHENELFWIYLVGGLVSIVGSPGTGILADKFGKRKVFLIGTMISMIPLYFMTHVGHTPLMLVVSMAAFFFLTMSGRMIPAMTMVSSAVTSAYRGSFMSFMSSVQQFSLAAAAYVTGLIVTRGANGELHHYNYVGILAISFSAIAMLLALRLRSVEGKL